MKIYLTLIISILLTSNLSAQLNKFLGENFNGQVKKITETTKHINLKNEKFNGMTIELNFSKRGNLINGVSYNMDSGTKRIIPFFYNYDSLLRPVSIFTGDSSFIQSFFYDINKKDTTRKEILEIYKKDTLMQYISTFYNSMGRKLLQYIFLYPDIKNVQTYKYKNFRQGRIVEEYVFANNFLSHTNQTFFTKDSLVEKKIFFDKFNNRTKHIFKYNLNRNIIEEVITYKGAENVTKTTYENYDLKNNWTTKKIFDNQIQFLEIEREIEYW